MNEKDLLSEEEKEILDTEETNEEQEDKSGCGMLQLSDPLMVDGDEVKRIDYDFKSVKPIQYINLVQKLSKKEQISIPELNLNVQIGFFALACNIPAVDLKRMSSVQDFNAACTRARNFLLGISGSETEEE